MKKIVNLLVYGGLPKKTPDNLVNQINHSNCISILTFSTLTTIILLIMTGLTFGVESIQGIRLTYILFLIPTIIMMLVTWFKGRKHPKVTNVIIYVFVAVLLGLGIMISTIGSPNETTATYIALLLTVPQLFTGKVYRMHLVTILMDIIFIYCVLTYKVPATWTSDIINACIFTIISMALSTYSTYIRISRFEMEIVIRQLAEIDQLTGLKNRNSYEMALYQTTLELGRSSYCIYLDVNGLHELNNTKGHSAGDEMLKYVAKAMQDIYGEDNTYRIGGDEFVAIGQDWIEEKIVSSIRHLNQLLEKKNYHAAIGYSFREAVEVDINKMIKEAEVMMYEMKNRYYESLED